MPPVKNLTAARRRRAAAERAEYLHRKTDGGAEVWDFYLAMMRDPDLEMAERERAARWIDEHSVAGKAATNIDVNVNDDSETDFDLSGLSLEELRAYEGLLAKAAAAPRLSEAAESTAQAEPDLVEAELVPEVEP